MMKYVIGPKMTADQDVAVEAAAAVQVAGAQEDPAAQDVHATISSEVTENAHSAALLRGRLLKADDCPARPDLDVLYSEVVVRQGSPGCFQRLLRAPGAVVGAATHDAPSRPAALRPLVQALLVSRADRAGLCVPVGKPPRSYRAGSRRSSPLLALVRLG